MEECPICLEALNVMKNAPYVLSCGHTMCKGCVLQLQGAVLKVLSIPIKLCLFISCPWCNFPSIRVHLKGNLILPCKNYSLLWMVEGRKEGSNEASTMTSRNSISASNVLSATGLRNRKSASDSSAGDPSCSTEVSSSGSLECMKCALCQESFDTVKNIPYILFCGHTMCRDCIFGHQQAIVRFPLVGIGLPFLISCKWCNIPSVWVPYGGNLALPRKNYFLLSIVEGGDRRVTGAAAEVLKVCPMPPSSYLLGEAHDDEFVPRSPSLSPGMTSRPSDRDAGATENPMNAGTMELLLWKPMADLVHLIAEYPLLCILILVALFSFSVDAALTAVCILVAFLLCAGLVS